MKGQGLAAGAFLATVAALALGGCGGSSTPSSSVGGSSPTSTPLISVPAGSSFCLQSASIAAQFAHASSSIFSVSPGATPSITAYQQAIAATTSAIDGLDSSAPGEIASSVHVLRVAYDQLNTQMQGATSLQQLATLFTSLDTPAIKAAGTAISDYLKNTCGITPSP
jgi:hypothetical protein